MLRRLAPLLALCPLIAAAPAKAVVLGSPSFSSYTVRLVGLYHCSGVVLSRRVVATAAHCARRGMRVETGFAAVGFASVTRSARLDDGRHVSVAGDAALLNLAEPLPFGVSTAPIGAGSGDSFTIAGYGTVDEHERGIFGALHEARLVAASSRALVDPNRHGLIGASACFGDSGGPVLRGGELVGIITRAAHPSPRIACGDLTRWAAVTVSGEAHAATATDDAPAATTKRGRKVRGDAAASEQPPFNLFGLFAPKPEASTPRKQARR